MDNLIQEAIEWATHRLTKVPSIKTIKQYENVANRLKTKINNGMLPGSSANHNTRSVERSAFRYCAARYILLNKNSNPLAVKQVYEIVKNINQDAKIAQEKYANGKEPITGKKFPNNQLRKSKRSSLKGLPPNWREQLIEVSSKSKFSNEIRIISICGCRPSEIEKGIKLKRIDNLVEITIFGAKCSNLTKGGQAWRALVFSAKHPLMGEIKDGIYHAKAKAIEDAISHFGRKISNKKKNPISAYSLRHAAASAFKAAGLSDKEVAAALGHQSTGTMSFYGTKIKSSGLLSLQSVRAASPVRIPNKKTKPKKTYI